MRIQVQSELPAAAADQMTALIDLGEDRPLYTPEGARQHPAWGDLERRRKQDTDRCSSYLALGEAPLFYLPATDAKFWDDDEKVRILASRAYDAAFERKANELVVLLDGPAGSEAAALAAEGIALRDYRFEKYKSQGASNVKGGKKKEPTVTLVVSGEALDEARLAVERALRRVEATNRARDLINEPGSVVTPQALEDAARKVAKERGLRIEVLDAKRLEKDGYQGLLTVGRAGAVPPRMIVLSYDPSAPAPAKGAGKGAKGKGKKAAGAKPAKAAAQGDGVHLGLLGKGITFDSGGISIKPSAKMWEMKGDMSGAAAVLSAIDAIASEGLPIRVTAIIVTAQNYVDKNSTMPGDVFQAKNGKFVHVDNTDAEGRLILTDGLWRMGEEGVTHLVDVATLTGACVRALGTSVSGVLGNDEFADEVAAVAATQGEPCWRLPIVEEYMEWLKTDVADINNIAPNGLAGASTAALFLREFLPAGVHWAHLDIAGTFIAEGNWKYYRPGATGIMVRSLTALAEKMAQAEQ